MKVKGYVIMSDRIREIWYYIAAHKKGYGYYYLIMDGLTSHPDAVIYSNYEDDDLSKGEFAAALEALKHCKELNEYDTDDIRVRITASHLHDVYRPECKVYRSMIETIGKRYGFYGVKMVNCVELDNPAYERFNKYIDEVEKEGYAEI